MAPGSPEDRQDHRAVRRNQRQASEGAGQAGRPAQGGAGEAPKAPEQMDFGAFVSRSVRSSADRLKGGRGGERPPRDNGRPVPPTAPGTERPAPVRRERPSRYWRDSFRERSGEEVTVRGTGARRFLNAGQEPPAEGGGRDGGAAGGGGARWQSWLAGGGGQGPNQRLLGAIAIGALLLIALVFLVSRLGGDDDGGAETPTPSATNVLQQPVGTPGPTRADEAPATPEDETSPTPPIRRGGDNQRQPTESETPGAGEEGDELAMQRSPAELGPIARSCPKACLIRLEGTDDVDRLYADTGSRPSFEADGVAWLVSGPEQIAWFEQEQASVEIVRKSADTLGLYAVEVPAGGDEGLLAQFGEVLDAAGQYRLIEVDELPARVRGLADAGFDIRKLAPPPASVTDAPVEQSRLSDVEIGSLMGEVSAENVEETIDTLQAIDADGSALGTRYYTLAGNQMAADYLYRRLESYGIDVWFEEFLTPEGLLLVNVVGELPGRDRSAVYAVMAHFDTISSAPGTAPGADDNATGIAASLEIARVMAGYELKHPVRIVFTNAEEVGILGSNVWAREARAERLPIEGVFNVDAVGSNRQGRLLVLNSDARSAWMQDLMIRINDVYGLGNEIMSRQNPQIVADDNMVREQGIESVLVARELYGWSQIHHTTNDVAGSVSVDNVLSTTYLVLLSVAAMVQ